MTDRIIVGSDGRKYITNEPAQPTIGCVQHDCEKCKALEAQVNTCGAGAGCLHKDARIEALEAEVGRLKTMPMKYRRMVFNAELQNENANLRAQLAEAQQAQPERAPSDAELETMWASENGLEDCQLCKRDDFIKAAKYFYLKQGGQHD